MWDVSRRYLDALRQSHGVTFQADVWVGGSKVLERLPVTGGSLRLDCGSQVWRTADFTVAGADLQPYADDDPLSPLRAEVAIASGIVFADGLVEWVPLGRLRLDTADWSMLDGSTHVTASDRMAALGDYPFESTAQSRTGVTIVSEITRLITDVNPAWTVVDRTGATTLTPATPLVWDDDRVAAVQQLAAAIGAQVWCDPLGRFVIGRVPAVTGSSVPVWWVDAGARGVLLDATPKRSRAGAYNLAIVTGTSSEGVPLVGRARDLNPDSPTRWGGPFGKVSKKEQNSAAWTQSMVDNAARVLLIPGLGATVGLDFTALPNHALDGYDVVGVRYPNRRVEMQVLYGLGLDFGTGSMTATARSNR